MSGTRTNCIWASNKTQLDEVSAIDYRCSALCIKPRLKKKVFPALEEKNIGNSIKWTYISFGFSLRVENIESRAKIVTWDRYYSKETLLVTCKDDSDYNRHRQWRQTSGQNWTGVYNQTCEHDFCIVWCSEDNNPTLSSLAYHLITTENTKLNTTHNCTILYKSCSPPHLPPLIMIFVLQKTRHKYFIKQQNHSSQIN